MKKNVNACCSGDMLVMTAEGVKSFKDLASMGKDVPVYCLNENGEYTVSMMIHPRVTGYNVEVYRVKLENGLEFIVTPEHRMLTDIGYIETFDIVTGFDNMLLFNLKADEELLFNDIVEDYNNRYTNLTKKGTLMKSCEYCGEMFELVWDDREVCACNEHHTNLSNAISEVQLDIAKNCKCSCDMSKIVSVEYVGRMDVYNGTVERHHNYFIVDEKTHLMINQLNCGETYINK